MMLRNPNKRHMAGRRWHFATNQASKGTRPGVRGAADPQEQRPRSRAGRKFPLVALFRQPTPGATHNRLMANRADRSAAAKLARRKFVIQAGAGSTVAVLGGVYYFSDDLTSVARAQTRPDGRPRLPPGQRVIAQLKPMGGQPGNPNLSGYRLKVHGEVEHPFELTFAQLLELPQVTRQVDVHCVTGWSMLDSEWKGVRLSEIAQRAGIKDSARHVIFEAAHGYTANVPRADALRD